MANPDFEIHLEKKPPVVSIVDGKKEVTEGDTHGNPIRILYTLVRSGICKIDDENYQKLIDIYKDFQKSDLKNDQMLRLIINFHMALQQLTLDEKNQDICYRLIGDLLADRGPNDILNLMLLDRMNTIGVNYRIMYSNHDSTFLRAYFDGTLFEPHLNPVLFSFSELYMQGRSLLALHQLIQNTSAQHINREYITNIVQHAFLPKLMLVDYSKPEDSNQLTLYTHAPTDLNKIQILAEALGVEFKKNTNEEIQETIQRINEAFIGFVQCENLRHIEESSRLPEINLISDAINHFIWRRDSEFQREPSKNGLIFVNGHCSNKKKNPPRNVHIIDNEVGKIMLDKGKSQPISTCVYESENTLFAPIPTAPNQIRMNEHIINHIKDIRTDITAIIKNLRKKTFSGKDACLGALSNISSEIIPFQVEGDNEACFISVMQYRKFCRLTDALNKLKDQPENWRTILEIPVVVPAQVDQTLNEPEKQQDNNADIQNNDTTTAASISSFTVTSPAEAAAAVRNNSENRFNPAEEQRVAPKDSSASKSIDWIFYLKSAAAVCLAGAAILFVVAAVLAMPYLAIGGIVLLAGSAGTFFSGVGMSESSNELPSPKESGGPAITG